MPLPSGGSPDYEGLLVLAGVTMNCTSDPTLICSFLKDLKNARDPRTIGWTYVGNPFPVLLIISLYVYVVKCKGPQLMMNRDPYDLTTVIRVYNVCMVFLNLGFMMFFFRNTYLSGGYSWFCTGIDFKPTEQSMAVVSACWWYFHVRMAEFMDTIFFVLRKKTSQVSCLHVIHHSVVVWSGWMGLTFGAEGQPMLCVCINSLVHVIMYTYYFLSSFGPAVKRYLWWKRHLTLLQIIQLAFFSIYTVVPVFHDCNYPRVMSYVGLFNTTLIFFMFCNFYIRAYNTRKGLKAD